MKPAVDAGLASLTTANNMLYKDKTLKTLGEIAIADYRNALVLNKYRLNYGFHGKYTLQEACDESGITMEQVQFDLNEINHLPRIYNLNYNDWAPDYLADFIVTNHHQYVRKSLILLTEEFDRISSANHLKYPFLALVGEIFQRVATDMSAYLIEEEQVIVPYIRFLVQARKSDLPSSFLPTGCLEHRLAMMETEQKIVGENIECIRQLCNNYTLPHGDSSSCTVLFEQLNDFDNDLQQHVHLENNILFPKVIRLEKECLQTCNRSKAPGSSVKFPKNQIETLL